MLNRTKKQNRTVAHGFDAAFNLYTTVHYSTVLELPQTGQNAHFPEPLMQANITKSISFSIFL